MEKINIGYFADGPWSHEALNLFIKDTSICIKFICVRYDTSDVTLKTICETLNIPYLRHPNVNSDEFIEIIDKYKCDVLLSMSFNQIFKSNIINKTKYGIINCHAGKLPFYRGRNILNWVLINDEKEFGITTHFVDEGIDTGDIILQRVYPITDQDDYRTLLQKAYKECGSILCETIEMLKSKKINPIKQEDIHPVGLYCGMRIQGDENINWNQTSRELFNFIRAICKPGPMAQSLLNNKCIKINKAKMIENAPIYKGIPGQILRKTSEGFIIKTLDTILEITEYEYEGNIRIGDRLK